MGEVRKKQGGGNRSVEERISDRFQAVSKQSVARADASETDDSPNSLFDKEIMEKLRDYIGQKVEMFDMDIAGDGQLFYIGICGMVFGLYNARFAGESQPKDMTQLNEFAGGLEAGISLKSVEYEKGYRLGLERGDEGRKFVILSETVNIEEKRER